MAKEGKYPQGVGGPPVGLIAIKDNRIVGIDALVPHQGSELFAIDEIASKWAQ